VTPEGLTLRGTAEGTCIITGTTELPADLALTVTESTETSRPVRGTIAISGTRTEPGFMLSALTGTFRPASASPNTPAGPTGWLGPPAGWRMVGSSWVLSR
jgi:hypothetical protein